MTVTLNVMFQHHPYQVELQQADLVQNLADKLAEISHLDPENQIILAEHVPTPLQLKRPISHYQLCGESKLMLLGQQTAIADPRQPLSAFQLERVKRQAQRSNPVGLTNDGNLCYLASAVQFMASVAPFSAGVAEQRDGSPLFQAIARIFKQLGLRETTQPTRALGDALRARFPQFQLGAQADAQEALENLENVVLGEFGGISAASAANAPANSNATAQNGAASNVTPPQTYGAQLAAFGRQNGIKSLFAIHLSDQSVETFLRVTAAGVDSIEDAISVLLDKRKFIQLPPMLQIQVLRFTASANGPLKLTRKVAFTPEITLQEHCDAGCKVLGLEKAENQPIYTLKAVIAHKGLSIAQGHYVCYARHGKQWYLFDDAVVQAVDEITVLGCAGSSGMGYTSFVILYCLEHMLQ